MNRALKFLPALVVLCLVANVASTEDAFFDSDGVKIFYTVQGEGEPLILIHGYSASGSLNWGFPGTAGLLAEHFKVITPDVRGHGKSDKPEGAENYGVNMVHDIARLMDHLDIESAHMAGYSMGGMITIKFMTMWPERVRSAAVCGMGWYEPRPEGEGGDGRGRGGTSGRNSSLADVAQTFAKLSTTKEQMLAIKTPTIAIVGAEDPGQLARVERWNEIRTDLNVVTIPGANHMTCSFNRDFQDALKEFFKGQAELSSE